MQNARETRASSSLASLARWGQSSLWQRAGWQRGRSALKFNCLDNKPGRANPPLHLLPPFSKQTFNAIFGISEKESQHKLYF